MKPLKYLTLPLFLFSTLTACADEGSSKEVKNNLEDYPTVELQTNKGNILVQLNRKKAPKTVKNFLSYANSGFYNGTIFHRVIDGFMIQGGGFDTNLNKKVTNSPIINEAKNGLQNVTGSIAMARTSDPNSATSQFFINVNNNDFLNYPKEAHGYAVFGKVVSGMDVVNNIKSQPTENRGNAFANLPKTTITINKVIVNDSSQ